MQRPSQRTSWPLLFTVVVALGVAAAPAMALPRHAVTTSAASLDSGASAASSATAASPASPITPTVGSSNTATADPAITRPATTPCTVQLFSGVQFADFTPKTFAYAPPAACPGPWAKVVLVADFSVSAGRQFDRTAQISIGHVNVYYGTTPEPSSTVSPSWHVERDLTDYGALLRAAQSGDANIGNLVDDTYTGIISGSASLQIYPAKRGVPAPRTADVVLPLSTDPGGATSLAKTTDVLAPELTLPANVEAAYLDVVAQSQSDDEFWYTCVPDDQASNLESCGGTAFREVEVTVDGTPAGVAPVYPWIYTGGIDPLLWRPIPGVQTLNFAPYRVNLTPFAALLSAGGTHKVGVSVFNSNNYFNVAATLLLFLDSGARHITGAVTQNTLSAAPVPTVTEDLGTDPAGDDTATIKTSSARHYTLAGYVNTSHGRVVTRIDQEIDFSNDQGFVLSAAAFTQDIAQTTAITTGTLTRQGSEEHTTAIRVTYPLAVKIVVDVNADGSGTQATTIAQGLDSHTLDTDGSQSSSTVTDTVNTKDTLLFDASGNITGYQDRAGAQSYFTQGTGIPCYSRSLTSANGALTGITDGGACRRY
jgi:hypothetical protein